MMHNIPPRYRRLLLCAVTLLAMGGNPAAAIVVDFSSPTYGTGPLVPQDGWENGNSVGGGFLDATVDATAGTLSYSGAGGAATISRTIDPLIGAGIEDERFMIAVDFQFTLGSGDGQVLNLGFNDNKFRPNNPDRLITRVDLGQGQFLGDSPNSGSTALAGLFTTNGAVSGQLSDRLRLTREWTVGATTDWSTATDWTTRWTLQNLDTSLALIDETTNNVNIASSGNWVNYDSSGVVPVLWGPAFDAGQPTDTSITIDRIEYTHELPVAPDDRLRLNVDAVTGAVEMRNGTLDGYQIDYYEITSSAGSLSPANWLSLDDQNIDAVDGPDPGSVAGDSIGEGWTEAPNSHAGILSEVFLTDSTILDPGNSLSLGAAFVPGAARDLVVKFGLTDGSLIEGDVFYSPEIIADFNGDQALDCLDADLLVAEIAAAGDDLLFDLSGDGQVTTADLDLWLAEAGAANLPSGASYLYGDANLDGTVDGVDFILWNNNKFSQTAAWCGGDFNADGSVDGQDFVLWNNSKFTSADGVSSVPEPGHQLLLLWLAIGLMGRAVTRAH